MESNYVGTDTPRNVELANWQNFENLLSASSEKFAPVKWQITFRQLSIAKVDSKARLNSATAAASRPWVYTCTGKPLQLRRATCQRNHYQKLTNERAAFRQAKLGVKVQPLIGVLGKLFYATDEF